MGMFGNISKGRKAMKALQDIKKGKTAQLSYSMLSMTLVNMLDARSNLTAEEFSGVYNLYKQYQSDNTMYDVDLNKLNSMVEEMVEKFNEIAPFESYCGY